MSNRDLRKLIFPLILEQLLAVSVGMVDTFMVSTVGEVAVSGVALVDNINRLIIQVMSAFAAGGIVVVSQYIGCEEEEKAKKTYAQLDSLMTAFSLIMMVICLAFSRKLLKTIFGSIDDDVMEAANIYLLVTAVSYLFLGSYNVGAAILRCLGDTKTSMKISLIMNVVNMVLNAVFVFGFGMGVFGVALATLIGRITAGVIMKLIAMSQRNSLRISDYKMYLPDWKYVGRILRIGVPSGIENGMFQIGKLMVVSMVATLGTNAIAANSIAYQIIDFPCIPGTAIGLALVVLVGQDIGADKKDMAVSDTKRLVKMAYIGDWTCKLTLFAIAPLIVSVFSLSQGATATAIQILRWFCIASLAAWPLSFTLPNALRGAGDVKFTMIVSVASMWMCRIVVSYVLIMKLDMGVLGVWIGMFSDWYVRAFFYVSRFLSKKWLEQKAI
jgi:putative MATE family efflux protein